MTFNYDGVTFRSDGLVGHYHQEGEQVWAEFAGGKVRRGSLVGTCAPDGMIELVYCQLLTDGRAISGSCTSTPELLADGRIRLREQWRRYGAAAATGVSFIEQVR